MTTKLYKSHVYFKVNDCLLYIVYYFQVILVFVKIVLYIKRQ